MSVRRATQENRFRTIPAQQPLAFAHADAAPAKATSHKCASIALRLKGGLTQPIPHQRRTAQCPLKGTALPANNKPRTKGLPWWNLLANLTVIPGQLVWIFMGMSVVGLMGETLQHLVAFGELESRAGFIWGPFSPIYGLAAVLLTMLLEPLQDKGVPLLLTVSAVVGGSLEYFASWAMETFWGVVAWSYLNIPLNFDGRTDVFHCLIWGTIGVLWVKVGLQLCQRIFNHVNTAGAPYRAATAALSIFMALDIAMTIIVLLRADARTDGIPPQNPIEQFCDTAYPTDMLQKRFHNMGGLGI